MLSKQNTLYKHIINCLLVNKIIVCYFQKEVFDNLLGSATTRGCEEICTEIQDDKSGQVRRKWCCSKDKCNSSLSNMQNFFNILYMLIFEYYIQILLERCI